MRNSLGSLVPNQAQLIGLLIPALLGLYLVLTSTLYLSDEMAVLDTKRVLEIFLFTAIILLAMTSAAIRETITAQLSTTSPKIKFGLLLFFALGTISAVVNSSSSLNLAYSLADVAMFVLMTITILIVAACRSLTGFYFDRLTISLITLLGLAVGMQELVGTWATWSAGAQFSYDWALAYFAHPRFYNQLQSWTVPAIAALPLIFPKNRLAASLCIIALGLHWYVLLLTGARGSIVSLLLALFAAALFSPSARRIIVKWQTMGILLGLAIYFSMFLGPETGWAPVAAPTLTSAINADTDQIAHNDLTNQQEIEGDSKQPSPFFELSLGRHLFHTTGRTYLWKAAFTYSLDHPVLGIGPENFACQGPPGRVGSPHNFGLQIVSEWGLPAAGILIFIVVVLLRGLRRSLRSKTGQDLAFAVLLACSVIAAIVHASVSGVFITPASQVAACLMSGWLLGVCSEGTLKGLQLPVKQKIRSIALLLMASIIGLMLIFFALRETTRMPVYSQKLAPMEASFPRFWQLSKVCGLDY